MAYVVYWLKYLVVVILLAHKSGVVVAESMPLKMGIISLASPAKIYKQWQPFSEYLSKKLNRKVEIVVPRGFKKIQHAVENKDIDIFFINSHIFYRLKQKGKAVGVVQMKNLEDSAVSHSVLFVRSDSGINTLKDLQGEKVAFVSPMGAGGYLAPRAAFYKEGMETKTDTQEQFTKNITTSVHKVLLGSVKAGTMCGLNFKLMSKRMDMGDLKIISKSDDYPEAVFGARNDLSVELIKNISSVMVSMYDDEEGKKVLVGLGTMKIKNFVKYDKKSEDITKRLLSMGELKNK